MNKNSLMVDDDDFYFVIMRIIAGTEALHL